ncbi:RNB domain-containing ribonuclease [Actinomadura madurae]|uniref:RNB domain-containing ribonuclease n=1 Tax=Actinomadura madurae TaxID=1993 RepID=UPI0020D20293|nr:RNB domain-containing ribonuclease [Actinomadura madurae]MCP9977042.1 RNB domain-containing ribonuclease [Actinomadura madurae]
MPRRPLRLRTAEADAEVRAGLDRIRAEYSVPGAFPPAVLAEAAGSGVPADGRADLRDVPFFTLDPPGSMDLDQAMHLERRGSGHRVRYAIADVAGFVRPGGALDAEARARGVTLYLPDANSPLHPRPLSEGSASLLPGRDRPAVAWTIDIDDAGRITGVDVRRAIVRSRDRLDYATARHDDGDPRIALLGEIGERLIAAEAARGGVSLPLPEQEVVHARRRVGAEAARRPRDRGVERADLAADRAGRGPADAGRRRRAAAHDAARARRGGRAAAAGGPRARRRLAGGRLLR